MFRTELIPDPLPDKLNLRSPVLLLGSCFTEYIGVKMIDFKFETLLNPSGVIYNPVSLYNCIDKSLQDQIDIENNVDGERIVWIRKSVGTYVGFKAGAFVPGEYSIQNLKPYNTDIGFGGTPTFPLYVAELNRLDDDNVLLVVKYSETERDIPVPSDGKLDDIFDWKFEYIQKSV